MLRKIMAESVGGGSLLMILRSLSDLQLEHLPEGVLVTCLVRKYFVQCFEILCLHWSFNIVLFLLVYYVGPNVIETSVARTDLNNSIKVRVDKQCWIIQIFYLVSVMSDTPFLQSHYFKWFIFY